MTMTEAYESVYSYRMDRIYRARGLYLHREPCSTRAVLAEVGPSAGIGEAEDRHWGRRATVKGYRVRFVPEVKFYHPAQETRADLFHTWDRQCAHDYADARARSRRRRSLLSARAAPRGDGRLGWSSRPGSGYGRHPAFLLIGATARCNVLALHPSMISPSTGRVFCRAS
jgi:hypothetical protein